MAVVTWLLKMILLVKGEDDLGYVSYKLWRIETWSSFFFPQSLGVEYTVNSLIHSVSASVCRILEQILGHIKIRIQTSIKRNTDNLASFRKTCDKYCDTVGAAGMQRVFGEQGTIPRGTDI